MKIFHSKVDENNYLATIISDKPIFITYRELINMTDEFDMSPEAITFCLCHDECPTPINHNDSIDGAPEDGIWIYDRLVAFFDWMLNCSAYTSILADAKYKALSV